MDREKDKALLQLCHDHGLTSVVLQCLASSLGGSPFRDSRRVLRPAHPEPFSSACAIAILPHDALVYLRLSVVVQLAGHG